MPEGRDRLLMSLWEISFRTQYDYPFMKISARHPGLPISMWCIWNREMIQVPTLDVDVRVDEGPSVRILHFAARCHDGEHRPQPRCEPIHVRRAPAEGREPDRGQPDPVLAAVRRRREEAGEDAPQRDAARADPGDLS